MRRFVLCTTVVLFLKEQASTLIQRQAGFLVWYIVQDLPQVTMQSLADEIKVFEINTIIQLVVHLVYRRRTDACLSREVSLREAQLAKFATK